MDELIKKAFSKVKEDIALLKEQIDSINYNLTEIKRTIIQTDRQTDQHSFETNAFENTVHKLSKTQNTAFSTGNEGVPADRQTDRQTDQQRQKFAQEDNLSIKRVSEIVSSIDSLKSDLLRKVRKLTPQEMLIFSTIYQLTDEKISVDYNLLAERTSLTESSIRDYVQKLIKKGVPIEKLKENNKKVTLSIPEDFKKIASLSTIISLRNI